MTGYHITLEGVLDHVDRLQPLLEQHVDELTTDRELMVLAPAWDLYANLEAADALFMLYAWTDDELVGYSCNIITPHLHYSSVRTAQNDVLFVSRPHRASRLGLSLLGATEREARRRGASLMLWHAKPETSLCMLLERRRAYRVQDIVYSRRLTDGDSGGRGGGGYGGGAGDQEAENP